MTDHLAAGRDAGADRRHSKVQAAITDTIRVGGDLSVSAIARIAGVDRSYLYRHRDILTQLHHAQTTNDPSITGTAVTNSSVVVDLANANARNHRLSERIRVLEKKLSEILGRKVWQNSGLGPPPTPKPCKPRSTTATSKSSNSGGNSMNAIKSS